MFVLLITVLGWIIEGINKLFGKDYAGCLAVVLATLFFIAWFIYSIATNGN